MEKIHANLEYKPFDNAPSDVVRRSFCDITGLVPNDFCPSHTDYCTLDSAPSELCDGSGHRPEVEEDPDIAPPEEGVIGEDDPITDPNVPVPPTTPSGGDDATDHGIGNMENLGNNDNPSTNNNNSNNNNTNSNSNTPPDQGVIGGGSQPVAPPQDIQPPSDVPPIIPPSNEPELPSDVPPSIGNEVVPEDLVLPE